MTRKTTWLVLSCLMVAALVLASCGPADEQEEETPSTETPTYGGDFIMGESLEPRFFDDASFLKHYAPSIQHTNEDLLTGDWAKGPAGTNETNWAHNMFPPPNLITGLLAETWQIDEPDTLTYHIRKGVHFHNKPPANGRELTADDVAFSLERMWKTSSSYIYSAYPWDTHIQSITTPDKWTVIIKCVPGKVGSVYEMASCHIKIVPRDTVEEYGDLSDWKNACGTGPFLLTDYVPATSMTFERNPNYWQKDPLHPKNQLPYIDGFKYLVITDLSTRMSAIRTAKVDWIGGYWGPVEWEDAESLISTNPELKYLKYLYAGMQAIQWRNDKPELPFGDIRVRRALALAINHPELIDLFYGGNAEIIPHPLSPYHVYKPIEQLGPEVKELFEYHPDKAKQLLVEAGYPDGFKTEIVCTQPSVDLLSVIKDYWQKIDVDLDIQVKEPAAFTSISAGRNYDQMIMGGLTHTTSLKLWEFVPGNRLNPGAINDPKINEAIEAVAENYFKEETRRQIVADIAPYILGQVYHIPLPTRYVYTFWQPWVKGYHGEHTIGYSTFNIFTWFIWIDQNMKTEMTGGK